MPAPLAGVKSREMIHCPAIRLKAHVTLNLKPTRRSFVSAIAALGAAILSPRKVFAAGSSGPAGPADTKLTGFGASGNVYEELGVTTVINGQGTMTMLGRSLMPPEAETAMNPASQHS